MNYGAILVSFSGLFIGFLAITEDYVEFGVSLSSLVLTGVFGFLHHNSKNDKPSHILHMNEETMIVIISCIFCLIGYKLSNKEHFIATATIFSSAISGFFGVSIQNKKNED